MKHRNTRYVVEKSLDHYKQSVASGLMQVTIQRRNGKKVVLPSGKEVVEFINCSYLGLDQHPSVVSAFSGVDPEWGVNFCCARSRFSIEPQRVLEEALSKHFGGRAIAFPSVTTTHITVMPLLASGILINPKNPPKVRMIFDRFAHASMQILKPILNEESEIDVIEHNSLVQLRLHVLCAKSRGETPVYVADGIYSMGGLCPIREVLAMAEELDFYVYIDDAHGTSIIGENGEGPILSQLGGTLPDRVFLTYCLSKGFGANGGGVLVSNSEREMLIRSYGLIYAFSAAMDFSVAYACLAALRLHQDGTVRELQGRLRDRVALYDDLMGESLPFSPIRMIPIGDETLAIEKAKELIDLGFFASVVFFPIVPKGKAQLRICISAAHSELQVRGLVSAVKKLLNRSKYPEPLLAATL